MDIFTTLLSGSGVSTEDGTERLQDPEGMDVSNELLFAALDMAFTHELPLAVIACIRCTQDPSS